MRKDKLNTVLQEIDNLETQFRGESVYPEELELIKEHFFKLMQTVSWSLVNHSTTTLEEPDRLRIED